MAIFNSYVKLLEGSDCHSPSMDSNGNHSVEHRRQDELPNLLAFLGFPNPDPQKCRELAAAWQHMAAPTGGSLPGYQDTRRESLLPNVTGGTKRPIPSTNTEVFLVIGGYLVLGCKASSQ
jgi:hypothetical protein